MPTDWSLDHKRLLGFEKSEKSLKHGMYGVYNIDLKAGDVVFAA